MIVVVDEGATMKRLLTAALALSLVTGTAAMAHPGHGDDQKGYDNRGHDERGPGNRGQERSREVHQRNAERKAEHRWARGERLPPSYYQSRTYYVDYRTFHLRRPPYGYQWVRVDDDYVLVALTTGLIASIIASNH
jgi:Ni/Co efflux regulator RcnB